MSTENGVWFSKKKLLKELKNAQEEMKLPISKRTHSIKKIKGRFFVWSGIPKKRYIKSGKLSLKRMGFRYIRLVAGDFFVSI
jgi:hypothetical protein